MSLPVQRLLRLFRSQKTYALMLAGLGLLGFVGPQASVTLCLLTRKSGTARKMEAKASIFRCDFR